MTYTPSEVLEIISECNSPSDYETLIILGKLLNEEKKQYPLSVIQELSISFADKLSYVADLIYGEE